MSGAWSMTEEGEWTLNEPYKSELTKIKHNAMEAWINSVIDDLQEVTPYSEQDIVKAFEKRVQKDETPLAIVDSFVIEALEGNL